MGAIRRPASAFALAGITDSLDGYYARKLGQTSRLGAFLDPVADKLIVAAALVLIVSRIRAGSWSSWRSSSSAAKSRFRRCGNGWRKSAPRGKMKVSVIGKYKTIMQIVGLSLLLFREDLFMIPVYKLGIVLTAVAAVLTLWSMIVYLRLAWPDLRGSANL